jgi:hypothetical protein
VEINAIDINVPQSLGIKPAAVGGAEAEAEPEASAAGFAAGFSGSFAGFFLLLDIFLSQNFQTVQKI